MASDQIGGIAGTLTQLNVPPQVAVGAYVGADHNNGVEALMLHDYKQLQEALEKQAKLQAERDERQKQHGEVAMLERSWWGTRLPNIGKKKAF